MTRGFRIAWVGLLSVVLAVLIAAWITVAQPWVMPLATHPPEVDAERLKAHVRRLSVDLHPRVAGPSGRLEAAADYVAGVLRESGGAVSTQRVSVGKVRQRNLIARFGPADGEPLVIGAHYDAHGGDDGDATPGAEIGRASCRERV